MEISFRVKSGFSFSICLLNLHRSLLVKLQFCLFSRIPEYTLLNLEPCGQMIKITSLRASDKIIDNGLTSNPKRILFQIRTGCVFSGLKLNDKTPLFRSFNNCETEDVLQ